MNSIKTYLGEVGQKKIILCGHKDFIPATTFSPNENLLASGSSDGSVRLWDLTTGCVTKILQGQDDVLTGLVFSTDGKFLTAVWHNLLLTWDVQTGKKVKEKNIYTNRRRHSVAFSNNREFLAYGTRSSSIKIRNIRKWRRSFNLDGHQAEVWAVRFNPKYNLLASSDIQNNVFLWDLETRKRTYKLEGHTDVVHDVIFSPDGYILASSSMEEDQSIKLWDVFTGREIVSLKGHTYHVWDLAFSPDGRWLVSGSEDTRVCFWDMKRLRELNFEIPSGFSSHENATSVNYQSGLSFSENNMMVAYGTRDNDILVWDLTSLRSL
jgi:WD40 repeat protein